jgi:outer membrane protein assembly factor BamB
MARSIVTSLPGSPAFTRRQALASGIALAIAGAGTARSASRQNAAEVAMFRADPARSNVFAEPGPAGDPVVIWSMQIGAGKIPQQPVVADGTIFIGTGEGIVALDAGSGERRWVFEGVLSDAEKWALAAGVVYVDGVIVAGSDFGVVYALDAESGEPLWELHGVAEMAQPTWADGLLYVTSDRNALYAIEAATGNQVWLAEADDGLYRWPSYANGRVYVSSWDGALHAYDGMTGALGWTHLPEPPYLASNVQVLANGLLYSKLWSPEIAEGETFIALNAASGTEVFRTAPFPTGMGYPTASDTTVYLGTPEGVLHALDAYTGDAQWQYDAGEVVNWHSWLVGDTLYMDSLDFVLHALDAATGEVRWRLPLDADIAFGLDVDRRKLFFATTAGTLWVIGGSESGAVPLEASPAPPVVTESPATPGTVLGPGFDRATVELLWTAPADAGLVTPTAAAISQQGFLFVVDASANDLKVFDPAGAFVESWTGDFRFSDGEIALGGISFDDAGTSYLSDSLNHRIQVFDPGRTLLATIGGEGDGPGQFRQPVAMVDRDGDRLLVADAGNGRIQVLDPDGVYLDQWGSPGDLNGQFRHPQAIAIGPDGAVCIADPAARRIQCFTGGGTYLGDIGTPNEMGDVSGIAFDDAGNLYAAAPSRGAVLIYGPDGTLLGTVTEVAGAGPLGTPRQLLLDARSDLYVLAGDRVLKLGFPPAPPPV